ncbi:putative transporter [Fusarium oxysporum f. sp. matthiolae]|nr:putative transporter [Fusarium oxysporum f. sp. matthiolae]
MSGEKQVDPKVANASSSSSVNEGAVISGRAADETLDLIEKHGHEIGELTPEKKKKLKRKIYIHVLLLVTFIDFMLYVDKSTLGQATLLGLFKDTGLNNSEYNNLNSLFYTGKSLYTPLPSQLTLQGYIIGQIPGQLLIQKLPLRTFISGIIFTWAIIVLLHCVAQSYGALIPLRFFLGFVESAVIPALEITMAMFFTPEELHQVQPLFYTSCIGSPMFTGLVSYGLLYSKASTSPWKFFMIITGGISLVLSVITWFWYPNNPATAWFLTTEQKVHTIRRIHESTRSSIEQKTFKRHQFMECLKDPISWLFAFSGFTLMLANNLPYQQSLLFLDLGVSPLGSTLVWVASGGFAILACITASLLIRFFPGHSAWWAALWCVPCIASSIGMVTIPWGNTIPMLACLLLPPNCFAQTWIISVGWVSSSCAGHTKRLTRNAMFMVLYGISNIISPQLWKTGGPRYYPAWIVQIVASFTLTPILLLTIRFILSKRNKERRQWIAEQEALGNHGEGYVEQVVDGEAVKVKVDVSMLDLTDLENKYFLYPL